jgi:hypothetical protein
MQYRVIAFTDLKFLVFVFVDIMNWQNITGNNDDWDRDDIRNVGVVLRIDAVFTQDLITFSSRKT